ncbi:MAG: InlB B-repeat-containing protein, partial [Oscillospiraceae bacterium]|nr:InlB B-repeat-containing protein [Oscillospiraceae bacterium]
MFKKLSVLFLVLIALFSIATLNISADETLDDYAIFSITDVNGTPGEQAQATLKLDSTSGYYGFQMYLNYDIDNISDITCENNSGYIINTDDNGQISIAYDSKGVLIEESADLLTFNFTVDSNISEGGMPLFTLATDKENIAVLDTSSGNEIPVTLKENKLKVYPYGDINLDLSLKINDGVLLTKFILGVTSLDELQLFLGDVNNDGEVNNIDVALMLQSLVGKDIALGKRLHVNFYDIEGQLITTKTVTSGGTLNTLPTIPVIDNFGNGSWSKSVNSRILTDNDLANITENNTSFYAIYDKYDENAIEYYTEYLTTKYERKEPFSLAGDLQLIDKVMWEKEQYAIINWSIIDTKTKKDLDIIDQNGYFHRPLYDSQVTLIATIQPVDSDGSFLAKQQISFNYYVYGQFITPPKSILENYLKSVVGKQVDGQTVIDYDIQLPQKITNEEVNYSELFEVRISWEGDGIVSEKKEFAFNNADCYKYYIQRSTTEKLTNLTAIVTYNGTPIEGDGKIHFDDVLLTAVTETEIQDYVVKQISLSLGNKVSNNEEFWHSTDKYITKAVWSSKNKDIATIENNIISIKTNAVDGSSLPLSVELTYPTNDGVKSFSIPYTVTITNDSVQLVPGLNISQELYDALKLELEDNLTLANSAYGSTVKINVGNLTTDSLKNQYFTYCDLSKYPEITDLTGLTYCTNLRVLNISGLQISETSLGGGSSLNEIATLNKLEALIARGCGIDNNEHSFTVGGVPVLKTMVNLKLLDLAYNNLDSLDGVLSADVRYGKLSEVYLNGNGIQDISSLKVAPILGVLVLSENGLEDDDIEQLRNFKYLRYLSLADNNITDVTPLEVMTNLTELRLQNNKISNIKALRKCKNLQAIYLGNNNLSNVEWLDYCTNLKLIYVNNNAISDISYLISLTQLESINVSNNNIDNLSFLSAYSETLEEVYAENNSIRTFSFISKLPKLRTLELSGNIGSYEKSLVQYLSTLNELQTLTLSEKDLRTLSFLNNMSKLSHLEIANCNIDIGNYVDEDNYTDNLEYLLSLKGVLRQLDISNNPFDAYGDIEKLNSLEDLNELTYLTVLYADNCSQNLNVEYLTDLMSNLQYISFENSNLNQLDWTKHFRKLRFVDLAGNNFAELNLGTYFSSSKSTLRTLYLDTNNPNALFQNSYRSFDNNNLTTLSIENYKFSDVTALPDMPYINTLNLKNTGITNLEGNPLREESYEDFTISRYGKMNPEMVYNEALGQEIPTGRTINSLETIDVSYLNADITPFNNMKSLKTVYAFENDASKQMFFKSNLYTLYDLYNRDVTSYLYEVDSSGSVISEAYTPNAEKEGDFILSQIKFANSAVDVSTKDRFVTDAVFQDTINGYDIIWSTNDKYYQIIDKSFSYGDYLNYDLLKSRQNNSGLEGYEIYDGKLTVTASIEVYPGEWAEKHFTFNMNVLDKPIYTLTVHNISNSEVISADDYFNLEEDSSLLSVEEKLQKTGYSLLNVYSDVECTEIFDLSTEKMPENGKEIWAEWKAEYYDVKFLANNGSNVIDWNGLEHNLYCGKPIGDLPEVTWTTYTFNGWYTAASGGTKVTEATVLTNKSETVILYAQWSKNTE